MFRKQAKKVKFRFFEMKIVFNFFQFFVLIDLRVTAVLPSVVVRRF